MRNFKLINSLLILLTLGLIISFYIFTGNAGRNIEQRIYSSTVDDSSTHQTPLSSITSRLKTSPLTTSLLGNSSFEPHLQSKEEVRSSEPTANTASKNIAFEIDGINEIEIDDESPDERFYQAALDWSADIGFMMVKADKDPRIAEETFNYLQNCTEDASTALAYRAICAANLKRLSKKQARLFGQKYAAVKSTFPPEVEKFLEDAPTDF